MVHVQHGLEFSSARRDLGNGEVRGSAFETVHMMERGSEIPRIDGVPDLLRQFCLCRCEVSKQTQIELPIATQPAESFTNIDAFEGVRQFTRLHFSRKFTRSGLWGALRRRWFSTQTARDGSDE